MVVVAVVVVAVYMLVMLNSMGTVLVSVHIRIRATMDSLDMVVVETAYMLVMLNSMDKVVVVAGAADSQSDWAVHNLLQLDSRCTGR
jgi:hypothetical protein